MGCLLHLTRPSSLSYQLSLEKDPAPHANPSPRCRKRSRSPCTCFVLRQETDGAQAEQLQSVPRGQELPDKECGRSRQEPRPAWIKDKTIAYFSFLRSRRPPQRHMRKKGSSGVRDGRGCPGHSNTSCHLRRTPSALESVLSIPAKRCACPSGGP